MALSQYTPKDYSPEARQARRQSVGVNLATLYTLLDLRDNPAINLEQERTVLRRFGKILLLVANKVADMLEDGKDLFAGFPYTAEQYRAAAARLDDLIAAQERLDETAQRIGLEVRALRVDLGMAVLDAMETQDSLARNRALDVTKRQRAEAVGAPVRSALASRNEDTQLRRKSTPAKSDQVAEAEGATEAAKAEAAQLAEALSSLDSSRIADLVQRSAPVAARTGRRLGGATSGSKTSGGDMPSKTPGDRRKKSR